MTDTEPRAPVIRSVGITLIGSAIGGVLVIAGEMLAARLLKSQAYGLYASGITIARIGEALCVFGLPVAIFHYIPAYRQKAQTGRVAGTVYAAAALPLALGSVFAAAVWLMAPWLARYVFNSADVVIYIRLLALAVPFMASSEVLGAITRGFGYAKYYVIVKNLTPPVVFLTFLSLMVRFDAQPLWITGAVASASLLASTAGVFAVVRAADADVWRVRPVFRVAELYGYSSGIMLNSFFYMIFAMTGILATAVFLGSESVGIYRVCLQLVVPFDMIMLAFHAAMGPIYPVLARENRLAELEESYGTAIRWMAMLLLPIGIVLAWNRDDLLALVGPEFMAGSTAVMILAIGYSAFYGFGTVAYLLMLSGRKSVETRNAAFATILNLILASVLVPRFGLAGAASATAFSFAVLNVLRIWEVRYLVGLRTFRRYFVRVVAVSAGAPLGSFVAMQQLGVLQGRDAGSIAARIAVMAAFYVSMLWTIGLDRRDRNMLRGLVPFVGRPGARPPEPQR